MTARADYGHCGPRLGRLVGEAALTLRHPARAAFGSLRTAVLCLTLVLTAILFVQLNYLRYGSYRYGETLHLLVAMALLSNVSLIYGTFNNKVQFVYGWMSFSILRLPLIPLCGFEAQYNTIAVGLPLCLLHLACEVILLALAHGHAHEESRGARADGGWLEANLAAESQRQSKCPPPPFPAVLAPSACTTANPPMRNPAAASPTSPTSPNSQC